MLITASSAEGHAGCPTCEKPVKVFTVSGNLAWPPRYMELRCQTCETVWKTYIDESRIEIIKEARK